MKKKIMHFMFVSVIAAIIFSMLLLQGCASQGVEKATNQDHNTSADSSVEKFGFEPGNISNGGIATRSRGWIFYSDISKNGSIFKMKADGSEKSQLTSDSAQNINVIDDNIYYVNNSDGGKIYSVTADGTGRKKVADDSSGLMYVVGDSIYYINESDYENIYKIGVNGENRTLIMDFQYEPKKNIIMTIENGWIYYQKKPENTLNKIRLDGTGKYEYKGVKCWNLNMVNGDMFYTDLIPNESADFAIFRRNADESQSTMLDSGPFSYNPDKIIVRGDWIYIIDQWGTDDKIYDEYSICRVKLDGSNGQRLTKRGVLFFNIVDDWIYFNTFKGSNTYRVKLDGSDEELLNN